MKALNYLTCSMLLVLFFTVAVMPACKKIDPPIASFEVNTTVATVFDQVFFTNTSTLAETYEWDFGDGMTSTSTHPTHQYANPGSYTVTLTAFGPRESDSYSLNLDITFPVSIYPGGSIDCVSLGDDFASIKNCYGNVYYHQFVFVDGLGYLHLVEFSGLGLKFFFLTGSSTLANSNQTEIIIAEEPFKGLTDKGIGVGSSFVEVEEAYGPAQVDEVNEFYEYPSLGIDFEYTDTPDMVESIWVYQKEGFHGGPLKEFIKLSPH